MAVKESVLSAIKKAGVPVKVGELAETTGIDKKEVDKQIKELVKEGKVVSPKRCFYEIKK